MSKLSGRRISDSVARPKKETDRKKIKQVNTQKPPKKRK